jgi:SAM-dependent methyltransferase
MQGAQAPEDLIDSIGARAVDYRRTPYLGQWPLRRRLVSLLESTLRTLPAPDRPLRVLEIGAGHGGYTGELLAAGCEVTAVEMSPPAETDVRLRYAGNPRLRVVADAEGSLEAAGEGYSLALCMSVLHHIPDYLALLDRVVRTLAPGGTLLTVADPLWYPRLPALTRRADRYAYLAWRIGQGDVSSGLAAASRRMRGEALEPRAGEIVYYHVVRQGVDEQAVVAALTNRFGKVDLFTYWSNHLGLARPAAERAGLRNTFGVRATGLQG